MKRGFSLIEILVAIGVFGVIAFAVERVFVVAIDAGKISANRVRANYLMEDYLEKIRNLRRDSWDNITAAGKYILEIDLSGNLKLTETTDGETSGQFTRYLLISDVYRDDGVIVEAGGKIDPSSKKAVVNVSWSGVYPGSLEVFTILTRYLDNLAWTQTTEADFNAGTLSAVTVTNDSGGEVILGAGGAGDWCDPNLTITSLDLPKGGVANAVTAIEGRAFAGTGENASGESFVNIAINNENPPVASILGTMNGYKTNAVFGEPNYGYIATDTNDREVAILDISNNPYSEIGHFDTRNIFGFPANADATSIYVVGDRGYVTAGYFLYIFDLSSKSGSRHRLGWPFFLLGNGTSVVVKGNYAYVSLSNSSIEMQIIDISNPWSIFQAGYANVNGQDGKRIFINNTATRAYLVTNASSDLPEFFIINTDQKSGSRPVLGSYDASGM